MNLSFQKLKYWLTLNLCQQNVALKPRRLYSSNRAASTKMAWEHQIVPLAEKTILNKIA